MNVKIENWKLLVLSVFYVIFAIVSYVIEEEQFLNFFMIGGIVIAVFGLLQIMAYFFRKDYLKPNEFRFSFGVLYGIAGIIIACKPNVIVDNYMIVLSCCVVLDSILRLQYSMNLLRLQSGNWLLNFLLALLPLLLGMVLILVDIADEMMKNCFSFLLLFDGFANFFTVLYYKHIVKKFGNSEELLDIAKSDAPQKEVVDGNDIIVR